MKKENNNLTLSLYEYYNKNKKIGKIILKNSDLSNLLSKNISLSHVFDSDIKEKFFSFLKKKLEENKNIENESIENIISEEIENIKNKINATLYKEDNWENKEYKEKISLDDIMIYIFEENDNKKKRDLILKFKDLFKKEYDDKLSEDSLIIAINSINDDKIKEEIINNEEIFDIFWKEAFFTFYDYIDFDNEKVLKILEKNYSNFGETKLINIIKLLYVENIVKALEIEWIKDIFNKDKIKDLLLYIKNNTTFHNSEKFNLDILDENLKLDEEKIKKYLKKYKNFPKDKDEYINDIIKILKNYNLTDIQNKLFFYYLPEYIDIYNKIIQKNIENDIIINEISYFPKTNIEKYIDKLKSNHIYFSAELEKKARKEYNWTMFKRWIYKKIMSQIKKLYK